MAETRCMASGHHERKRIFAWLSVETFIQTVVLIVTIATLYTKLDDRVTNVATSDNQKAEQLTQLTNALNNLTLTVARVQGNVEANTSRINMLSDSRDADRKLLIDLNTSVGILLDRSSKDASKATTARP